METITENYKTSILADATLKTVYDSICKVGEWWGFIDGPTHHAGDEFVYHPGETWVNIKIAEMIPDQRIVWYVIDCHLPFVKDIKEWKDTSMVWNLKRNEGQTEIDFEHVGLEPGVECYDGCVKGWDFYIKESLNKFITEGVGMPGDRQKK